MRPTESLDEMNAVLDELRCRGDDEVILVEGRKDLAALEELGVEGAVMLVQNSRGVMRVAEALARRGCRAVILTDWDRTGGQLADLLRKALTTEGVPWDGSARARISMIAKKDVKDVESLPALMRLLEERSR